MAINSASHYKYIILHKQLIINTNNTIDSTKCIKSTRKNIRKLTEFYIFSVSRHTEVTFSLYEIILPGILSLLSR